MVAHGELAGFLEQLDRRRARLTALAECGSGELRDEARTVGEELLAAREELRVQQEELVAAQAVAALTSANYNDIVASTDTAHLVTDLEGLILGANGAARALMTWPLLRWSRRPLVAHFTLPTRGVVRSLITLASRRAGHVTGEAMLRRSFEAEQPVRLAAVASPFGGALRWAVMPVRPSCSGPGSTDRAGPG